MRYIYTSVVFSSFCMLRIFVFAVSVLISGCAQKKEEGLLLRIANESLTHGNPEAAINFYDKAIQLDAKNVDARSGKAEALIALGKLDMALHEVNEGLVLSPHHTHLLYSKGKILLLRGYIEPAREIFKKLHNNFKALNALGTIYDAAGEHKQAQDYYRQAIRLNDQYSDAYGNLGLSIIVSGGEIYRGIEYLERAIALPGASLTQKNNLAFAYATAEEYDKAQAIYEENLSTSEAKKKIQELKKLKIQAGN